MSSTIRAWCIGGALLATLVSCGGEDGVRAPNSGVGGNTGGSGGVAGQVGSGGVSGLSGQGGSAGAGNAGANGTGGGSGTGGDGGSCASPPAPFAPKDEATCNTSAVCDTCPSDPSLNPGFVCASDADCQLEGYVCVPSGCTADDGRSLGRCQLQLTAPCGDCPEGYACGGGDTTCVRQSAGCSPETEAYDCAPGFTCECGACVDRRVPCDSSLDCPKSHTCEPAPTGDYCVRIYRDCRDVDDCALLGQALASACADVDGDGRTECAGQLDGVNACVNQNAPSPSGTARCQSDSAPICENGNSGSGNVAVCGVYGLCLSDADCTPDFECVALGTDGRKECVPRGPRTCDSNRDCELNQVCASPRLGGTPRCQAGPN
jgi:hypothetical protein